MRLAVLVLIVTAHAACGDSATPVDAPAVDAPIDADATADAETDDAPVVDAPVDGPADAPVDTPSDCGCIVDATAIDASAIDATAIDATPDAPPDATPPMTCNADQAAFVMGELMRARDLLLAYYAQHSAFPTGTALGSPATDCCTQNAGGTHCCAAVATDWSASPWADFGFAITQPQEFQFQYAAAIGDLATMTAHCDLDCDSTSSNWRMDCTSNGGTPSCTITAPQIID
jgi:hypothetical protein